MKLKAQCSKLKRSSKDLAGETHLIARCPLGAPSPLSTNLKSECRIPKPERSPNAEFRRTGCKFRRSGFGFLSDFGLRISDFRFVAWSF